MVWSPFIYRPKMRILLFIIYFFPILSFSSPLSKDLKDYRVYHKQINKAEKFIVEEQYLKAQHKLPTQKPFNR